MINKTKKVLAVLSMIIFGSALLYNCEPEIDNLGEQFFEGQGTTGTELSRDVIAYNVNNNDVIRADYYKLLGGNAVIGAFNEPQFGMQKSSYFTQLRMESYDPDFGTNAVVDSVVLVLKPVYETSSDSITTTTNEDYVYPDGSVAAKMVIGKTPVKKYGKTKTGGSVTPLTIKVHEVTEFMGSYTDSIFSNKDFVAGVELGSKVFDGNAKSVTITKDSDGTEIIPASTNDIRISLDKTFFQSKIIAKQDQLELKDMSNFIRYFRGLKVSVQENDGYLFSLNPNDTGARVIMYYKYDKVDNGTTTRPQTSFSFYLGSGNAHSSYIKYDRTAAQFNNYVLSNQTTGDLKLFAQGMGGPSIGIKFKQEVIDELRSLYKNNKAAIVSAKIRMYTDPQNWNNSLLKPSNLAIVERYKNSKGQEVSNFTNDVLGLSSVPGFTLVNSYGLDTNPGYYDITVTKTIKDIVEKNKDFSDRYLKIDIATFLLASDGVTPTGYNNTTAPYAKERVVFVGSDPSNDKKIQLKVIYGSK
jgi:hypothetical protein